MKITFKTHRQVDKYEPRHHLGTRIELCDGSQGIPTGFLVKAACGAANEEYTIDLYSDEEVTCERCLAFMQAHGFPGKLESRP